MTEIFGPYKNLAILENAFEPLSLSLLQHICESRLNDINQPIDVVHSSPSVVQQILSAAGWPTPDSVTEFIAQQIDNFSGLTRAKSVQMRLEKVETDMCSYLHVDNVHLRLIATLSGPTSMWLPNHCRPAKLLRKHNSKPLKASTVFLRSLPTGSIGLFKGRRFPGVGNGAIIHKSPKYNPQAPLRVLFVLDILQFDTGILHPLQFINQLQEKVIRI